MDNETIAWISAGAAVGGGLVSGLLSGAYQHWRDWFYSPELCLDYGANNEASRVEVKTGPGEGNRDDIFIRVRVRNTGRWVAKGCSVYLSSIEEIHGSTRVGTAFHDSMPVSWPRGGFEPRNIPNGADFYIDLVRISKHDPGWNFGVKQIYSSQAVMRKFKGTYRFHLVATAENAESARLAVDVKYEQDWNSLRAYSTI